MSEKKVALILDHMAERAAPGKEIDLWPALQTRFARAPFQTSAMTAASEGPQMKPHPILANRLRFAALLVIAILLAGVLFMSTPQGQAWAQSVLRFFALQPNDSLPAFDIPVTPTQPLRLIERSTQTALPAVTPTPPGCDSILAAHCTIEEVQTKIPFPIVQLGKLPKGMFLRGTVVQEPGVMLVYNCPTGCSLLLSEAPAGAAGAKEWVGASAQVKNVSIQTGKERVTGEYVQGAFYGQADGAAPQWDASYPAYTLRWEKADMQYSIQWSPSRQNLAELTPNETLLAALAESLTQAAPAALNPNFMLSAADASLIAGFTVRVPAFIPKGWDAPFYTYDPATGFVCLNFATGGMRDHPRLFLRESASAPLTQLQPAKPSLEGGTPLAMQVEAVAVGGADDNSGRFSLHGFTPPENGCNGQTEFYGNEALQWTAQGITYEIYASASRFSTLTVSKFDLVRMAESISGVTTLAADTLDPEHLWTLAEVKKLAGLALKEPVKLPEGYAFEMGVIEHSSVILIYQAPDRTPDTLDLSGKLPVIYFYQCPAQSDGQDPCAIDTQGIPAEAKEPVQIHQQPGFYAKGDLGADESSNWKMRWVPDHMFFTRRIYWKEGDSAFLLQTMWGGAIDRENLIAIAQSTR